MPRPEGRIVLHAILGPLLGFVQVILGLVLMFGGPILYLRLQARAFLRWHGWWRMAAVPPLLLMLAATALMVVGFAQGSNLAPVAVIFGAPIALIWLWVVALLRGTVLRRAGSAP
jgi:hypothetical protein